MEENTTPSTEYRPRVLSIEDVHPAEYATWWGNGSTTDGLLFYNCSEQLSHGRVTANPDWGPSSWWFFAAIVRRQLDEVRDAIADPARARDTGWTGNDADSLEKLLQWATDLAERGPQTFTYCDGESGRPIVRITEAQALGCSGSGAQDENVAATMPNVTWLGSADDIRRFLKGYGSWGAEELKDDAANRERALWVACNDVAENPEDYAD